MTEDRRETAIRRAQEMYNRVREVMKAARTDPERQTVVRYTQGTADGIRDAFAEVLCEVHAVALAQDDAIRQLRERITALEGQIAATKAALTGGDESPARLALVAGKS